MCVGLPTEASNPVFLELNSKDSLTRRNSYCQAIESDGIYNSETGYESPSGTADINKIDVEKANKKKAISFFRAFLIPGVIVVSWCCVTLHKTLMISLRSYSLQFSFVWCTYRYKFPYIMPHLDLEILP